MNCHDILLMLDDRDIGALDPRERAAVDAHLADCADCARAFRADLAMRSAPIPPMPAHLLERCRRRFARSSSATAPRRRAGRPVMLGALVLFGAASAALVGTQLGDPRVDADSAGAAAPPADPRAGAAGTAAATDVAPARDAAADEGASAGPTAVDAEPPAAAPGTYTVAIGPLEQQATDPETIRITQAVYAAFLEELRRLPHLDVIELDADHPSIRAATSARTLTLLDSQTGFARNGDGVSLDFVPSALINRIEAVTGDAPAEYGADAMEGVVNVILNDNIDNVRVDFAFGTEDAVGADGSEPLEHDVVLVVGSRSRGNASGAWQIEIRARSRAEGIGSYSFGGEWSRPASGGIVGASGTRAGDFDPIEFAQTMVMRLRENLLPPDPTLLVAIETELLDWSRPRADRLSALTRLSRVLDRDGSAALSDAAILGTVELVRTDADPRSRAQIWRTLGDLQDGRVVQPLSDALLYDDNLEVRLAAAEALAGFADDQLARAALGLAAQADGSAEVRLIARWGTLDEAGRRDHVVATLLDDTLTDAERLAPLMPDAFRLRPGVESVDLDMVTDANVARVLTDLVGRVDDPGSRQQLLTRLSSMSGIATPAILERLSQDDDERVRRAAAAVLSPRVGDPAVRAALERARANDPSALVRETADRLLRRPL